MARCTRSPATTLAGGFRSAGHTVAFGSRDAGAHPELAPEVADVASALDNADLVVSALQASVAEKVLPSHADLLAGHVLLDIGNAVTERFELMYPNASLGAALQDALPRTKVVKSLNTLGGTVTVAPDSVGGPTTVFLSGNDADAKALVSSLLVNLGWPVEQQIDLGGIETARGPEHYFLLFAGLMQALRTPTFNIVVTR
ncbi:NADPH-dependent F420 reductase [Mycetocola zhadangensis]|uniref:NADPH-dependent F420 reductase n=1 Tax=Mycetocola zhadangensis TaxID=1164595 RepID=UPI003A4DDA85